MPPILLVKVEAWGARVFLQVPPSPKCSLLESEASVTVPRPCPHCFLVTVSLGCRVGRVGS